MVVMVIMDSSTRRRKNIRLHCMKSIDSVEDGCLEAEYENEEMMWNNVIK